GPLSWPGGTANASSLWSRDGWGNTNRNSTALLLEPGLCSSIRWTVLTGSLPRDDAWPQLSSRPHGKVILQPSNRETAAGIFLGLTYIRAHDSQATVLIFPSDHFVYPEDVFAETASSLARAARNLKHWVFLLGTAPDSPEPEYGWIQPGAHLGWIDGYLVRGTQAFLEKPNLEACKSAMRCGALWNTMVIAAKVETLWSLGLSCFPEMVRLFEIYSESIGDKREEEVLEEIYQVMPSRNFSVHL